MAEALSGRLLIGGAWRDGSGRVQVRNPYDQALVGTVVSGTAQDAGDAVSAARQALAEPFPAHARTRVLQEAARLLENAAAEVASALAAEGSKTIREARREPPRAAEILRLSADAASRVTGETLPFDAKPGSENRQGYYMRVPAGVVAAILPFNDPLAVAVHKVGPALAAGNAVVLKPDSRTPFGPLRLAETLMEAGLPAGRLNVVTGDGDPVGAALVEDDRVRVVSFTGGLETGRKIARAAGIKKLVLELGSNSAVLVAEDADLEQAAEAITAGAFAQAGQNCLGVQRVFAHRDVYQALKGRIVERASRLKAGHSLSEETDVCAMITERQAARVQAWIDEAVEGGARVLAGGTRKGAVVPATVLEGVPPGSRLDCDEVYGPVLSLYPVESIEEGIARTNDVGFGLHAAIFTQRLDYAFKAARELEVGGVIVNDSTDYRLDTMPFGGVKGSGVGREGIDAAVRSMTEERVVCFNL